MCGRFTLRATNAEICEFFEATGNFQQKRMYNIPPGQTISIIRDIEGKRTLSGAHWGLLMKWAKDMQRGYSMINARAETITEKTSFKKPFQSRRCLIPVDGFYEWKRDHETEKTTYFIHRPDDALFAFAGIWQSWESPEGVEIDSCSIITTRPNGVMEKIHDRMPVILPISAYDRWLTTPPEKSSTLTSLLVPCPDKELTAYQVSSLVNKATNESEKCIEPFVPVEICDDTNYFKAQKRLERKKRESLFPDED